MFYWRLHQVRRTTLIGVGCVSFLAGIGVVQLGWQTGSVATVAVAVLLLLLCIKKWWLVALPAVVVSSVLGGMWRGSVVLAEVNQYRSLLGQKVSLSGVVRDDPTYGSKGQIDIRIEKLSLNGRTLPGSARVTSLQPLLVRRGDTVAAYGALREGFGGYQMEVLYAKLALTAQGSTWSEQARRAFSAAVFTSIPEPQASLGLGFLIGLKSMLPKNLDDQLKVLGLTHIVVASGYNLTVMVRAGRRVLGWCSKYQATALSGLLVAGFLTVTGFSSSMSRAALVTMLSLWAAYYGRQVHPALLLVFSGALTAAISPLYVWSDIGWYLSFLSFAGVLLLGPLVERRLCGRREPLLLVQIAIETTCAQVVTLPLILFIFGQFSVLSVIANMLIEPFIPLAMLLTFIVGVGGLILPPIGPWLGLPAAWLLSYMTHLSALFAQLPWVQLPVSVSSLTMILLYGCITGIGWVLYRRTRYNYLETEAVVIK